MFRVVAASAALTVAAVVAIAVAAVVAVAATDGAYSNRIINLFSLSNSSKQFMLGLFICSSAYFLATPWCFGHD